MREFFLPQWSFGVNGSENSTVSFGITVNKDSYFCEEGWERINEELTGFLIFHHPEQHGVRQDNLPWQMSSCLFFRKTGMAHIHT